MCDMVDKMRARMRKVCFAQARAVVCRAILLVGLLVGWARFSLLWAGSSAAIGGDRDPRNPQIPQSPKSLRTCKCITSRGFTSLKVPGTPY